MESVVKIWASNRNIYGSPTIFVENDFKMFFFVPSGVKKPSKGLKSPFEVLKTLFGGTII